MFEQISYKRLAIATIAVFGMVFGLGFLVSRSISNESAAFFESIQIGADMNDLENSLRKAGFSMHYDTRIGRWTRFCTFVHKTEHATVSLTIENGVVSEKRLTNPETIMQRTRRQINEWVGINNLNLGVGINNVAGPSLRPLSLPEQFATPPMEARYESSAYPKSAFDIPESTPMPVVQPFQGRRE
jgi:hypothetical protein